MDDSNTDAERLTRLGALDLVLFQGNSGALSTFRVDFGEVATTCQGFGDQAVRKLRIDVFCQDAGGLDA